MKIRKFVVIVTFSMALNAGLLFHGTAGAQDKDQQSLGALLHRVEGKSPDLSAAKARLESARAAVKIIKSRYFGNITLSARDSHFNSKRPINQTLPPITDNNQIDYGATFNLPIDINGRITAQYKAQRHLSDASAYTAENVRLALFKKTSLFYRGLQKLHGVRSALSNQKKALKGHYKITKAAIDAGRAAKVDLLRIKAEISAVEGKLAALDGDEQALRSGLAALLNQEYFGANIVPVLDMHTPNALRTGKEENGKNVAKPLPLRPDILAAGSQEMAESERLNDARREWLPTLALQATAEHEEGYDTNSQKSASITGRLSWELWDGGRRFAAIDKAEADLVAAKKAKRAAENRARSEITAAKAQWFARSAAYDAARSGLEAARETARIERDLYKNGRVSAVDLIDVEAALAQARANLTSSMADWWLADDQLNIAMGNPPSSYGSE